MAKKSYEPKNTSFVYRGKTFEYYGRNGDKNVGELYSFVGGAKQVAFYKLSGYDYKEFYRVAKREGCYGDVYRLDGVLCVPCGANIVCIKER